MKKKVLSVLLCAAMAASMLIGCGSKESASDTADESTATAEATDETVEAVDQRRVYVTPEWVQSVIDGEQPESEDYVILEVSYPMEAEESPSYEDGHVPGAIHASIMEVEDTTGDEEGAYNLLSAEEIRDYALSHGITKDTTVIMYSGDGDNAGVARQAYGYLYVGVENVKILNGNLDAWTGAGYDLETDANDGEAAEEFGVEVPAHPEYWTSIEDAKDKVENDDNFKLVSIRAEEEWLGETSGYNYMDKAGEPKATVWGTGTGSWTFSGSDHYLLENRCDSDRGTDGGIHRRVSESCGRKI